MDADRGQRRFKISNPDRSNSEIAKQAAALSARRKGLPQSGQFATVASER